MTRIRVAIAAAGCFGGIANAAQPAREVATEIPLENMVVKFDDKGRD